MLILMMKILKDYTSTDKKNLKGVKKLTENFIDKANNYYNRYELFEKCILNIIINNYNFY